MLMLTVPDSLLPPVLKCPWCPAERDLAERDLAERDLAGRDLAERDGSVIFRPSAPSISAGPPTAN